MIVHDLAGRTCLHLRVQYMPCTHYTLFPLADAEYPGEYTSTGVSSAANEARTARYVLHRVWRRWLQQLQRYRLSIRGPEGYSNGLNTPLSSGSAQRIGVVFQNSLLPLENNGCVGAYPPALFVGLPAKFVLGRCGGDQPCRAAVALTAT